MLIFWKIYSYASVLQICIMVKTENWLKNDLSALEWDLLWIWTCGNQFFRIMELRLKFLLAPTSLSTLIGALTPSLIGRWAITQPHLEIVSCGHGRHKGEKENREKPREDRARKNWGRSERRKEVSNCCASPIAELHLAVYYLCHLGGFLLKRGRGHYMWEGFIMGLTGISPHCAHSFSPCRTLFRLIVSTL